MPLLLNNQASGANNDEQAFEQDESSSLNGNLSQNISETKNEPVVRI